MYNYVISVCDESQKEGCPVFPGAFKHLHWSFEDPVSFQGSWEERLEKMRAIRDQIEIKIKEFIS